MEITLLRVGDNMSTVGHNISTVRHNISTVGNNISPVEGIQYSGRRILILACLAINEENILKFFVLRYKICIQRFRKFQQISFL